MRFWIVVDFTASRLDINNQLTNWEELKFYDRHFMLHLNMLKLLVEREKNFAIFQFSFIAHFGWILLHSSMPYLTFHLSTNAIWKQVMLLTYSRDGKRGAFTYGSIIVSCKNYNPQCESLLCLRDVWQWMNRVEKTRKRKDHFKTLIEKIIRSQFQPTFKLHFFPLFFSWLEQFESERQSDGTNAQAGRFMYEVIQRDVKKWQTT